MREFLEADYSTTDSGWMDSETFIAFLQSFDLYLSNNGIQRPALLLVDGHSTHCTQTAATFCHDHSIILYCLIAHSSHITQPLDVGVFGPMKAAYRKVVSTWQLENPDRVPSKHHFPEIFFKTWQQSAIAANCQSGFRHTGIYPFMDTLALERFPTILEEQHENVQQAPATASVTVSTTTDPAAITSQEVTTIAPVPTNAHRGSTTSQPAPVMAYVSKATVTAQPAPAAASVQSTTHSAATVTAQSAPAAASFQSTTHTAATVIPQPAPATASVQTTTHPENINVQQIPAKASDPKLEMAVPVDRNLLQVPASASFSKSSSVASTLIEDNDNNVCVNTITISPNIAQEIVSDTSTADPTFDLNKENITPSTSKLQKPLRRAHQVSPVFQELTVPKVSNIASNRSKVPKHLSGANAIA